jgi:uncharacterized membrane protein YphA (DoxX/SURF4 family)
MSIIQVTLDNWFVRHLSSLKVAMRVMFGVLWGIDGALKFQPGLPDAMVDMIKGAAQGQPGWLSPWFQFWSQTVSANPAFYVVSTGVVELALACALILGVLRKVAYGAGFLLSLVIWSVPEGFGGPYGPGSTDIGTGIAYAFIFLFLMIANAAFGPTTLSIDYLIEKKFPSWKKIAEIRSM